MLMTMMLFTACQKTPEAVETKPVVGTEQATTEATKPTEATTTTPNEKDYGVPFTINDSIPAADLLADPSKYVGQTVRVAGKVSDICQKKGCWLILSAEDKHMRVMTKGHGFFVDMDKVGFNGHIEGKVIARELNPKRTEHFASEASSGAPIPEKSATKISYEMVASSIRLIQP